LGLKSLFDRLAHYAAGFLTAQSFLAHPFLPIIGFLIFFLYELNQELKKDDWFDEEMREFGVGFFISVSVLIALWWCDWLRS